WQAERELEEARLAAALEEAERERARLAAAVEAAEARAALSEAELEKARSAGDRVATNVLGLSEAETRARLIDADLAAAGWDVGVDGQSTDEVGQEVPVTGLPQGSGTGGKSGSGLVDYVLCGVDGKPLAVVAGKRSSLDVENGRMPTSLTAVALTDTA